MHTVKRTINGKELSIETGRFAKLADGAVMVRYGDSMVLVTAVAAQDARPDIDFMPLTCDYREKQASSGKIPGGFFRREGRPTTKEILSSRLIDRPLRPMFSKYWRFETQIIASVYSYDLQNETDVLAAIGASAALSISNIPFNGPISEVRVGRIDGELIINPTHDQIKDSDLEILVAGSDSSIVMVEGASKEISENDFITAMDFAHTWIRELNGLQRELAQIVNPVKREPVSAEPPADIVQAIDSAIAEKFRTQIRIASSKDQRSTLRSEIKQLAADAVAAVVAANAETYSDIKPEKIISAVVKSIEAREMREMILADGKRLDGRSTTDIRPIQCDVGVLPRPHGSALFTRGETQSLTTVTLGTKRDQQLIDGLMPTYEIRYMLHYNFPPFSTGEAGRFGFTSRRETGHGDLAERALEPFIPSEEEFPYTIRVVSDILESNGSSSMATVCAGSLALYHAGVPMKKPVAGIAMGLIMEGDRVAILSDILGDEDFLGDMDFKVTGTEQGITACQMDIKIEGLSVSVMQRALEQARVGRLHILSIMNQTMAKPNSELSAFAPKLTTIQIPVEMIGAVIGPGGEMIRSIVKETGAEVDIDDDGTVTIAAIDQASGDAAIARIREITRPLELGAVYSGKVKEIREGLGAFVEILPKKQALLHISQLEHRRVANVSEILKVGDVIDVKLIEIQPDGKVRVSRKALIPPPEGVEYVEESVHGPRAGRPQHGDRGPRGHRDSEQRGRRDSEQRGPRDSESRGPRDSESRGNRDSEHKGHRDSEHRGHRDSETGGNKDSEAKEHGETPAQSHRDRGPQEQRDRKPTGQSEGSETQVRGDNGGNAESGGKANSNDEDYYLG
ncbi:MAG: polyribonucleotide nucleotidyltransferase [Ignavibacteria bacterium]|nr:polyribonucleotide nucleotidyltransferase [Ignavibacteria bacterium]